MLNLESASSASAQIRAGCEGCCTTDEGPQKNVPCKLPFNYPDNRIDPWDPRGQPVDIQTSFPTKYGCIRTPPGPPPPNYENHLTNSTSILWCATWIDNANYFPKGSEEWGYCPENTK